MTDKGQSKSIWKETKGSSDVKEQNAEEIEIIDAFPGKISKFVQQNSPINNELIRNSDLNNLYRTDADGQLEVVFTEVLTRRKTKQSPPVYTLCSFSYSDNVNLELINPNGRYKITAYDRRVYNAIGTLWLNGKKSFYLTELFAVMNGYARTNPSKQQLQAVNQSLIKFNSIKVYIDEWRAHTFHFSRE